MTMKEIIEDLKFPYTTDLGIAVTSVITAAIISANTLPSSTADSGCLFFLFMFMIHFYMYLQEVFDV